MYKVRTKSRVGVVSIDDIALDLTGDWVEVKEITPDLERAIKFNRVEVDGGAKPADQPKVKKDK